MQHLRPEGFDERENKISRGFRQRVSCRGDLAEIGQPRLYFLPSPWTHFLAPGLGQRKKQRPPRERERQKRREDRDGWERMEGGREGKKKTAAGLCIGIKTGANPFCIVHHDPLPPVSNSSPRGFMETHFADSGSHLSNHVCKNLCGRCSNKHIQAAY